MLRSSLSLAALLTASLLAVPAVTAQTNKVSDGLADPVIVKAKAFSLQKSQLDDAFVAFRASAAAIGERLPEDNRAAMEKELLNELILTKLTVGQATDADKAKAKTAAEETLTKIRARSSSEGTFKMKLRALGLSPEKLESQIIEQTLRKEVIKRALTPKVPLADADLKKFYDENGDQFERPETVRAAHILLSTIDTATKTPLTDAQKKEKMDLAKKLKERVEKGEDIGTLAKEFSEDPGSKNRGGEYIFARGEMVKPFEIAAFGLETNKVSEVVETQFGYHIIKVLEKSPAKKVSFEESSDKIREFLLQQGIQKLLPAYFEELKKQAGVEIVMKFED